jgi:hypothetical protein
MSTGLALASERARDPLEGVTERPAKGRTLVRREMEGLLGAKNDAKPRPSHTPDDIA